MKKYKKGELVKTILLLTVATGAVATVCVLPGLSVLFVGLKAKSSKERFRVKRTLSGMEARGLIKREVKNGKEILLLTPKGTDMAWSALAENMNIPRQKKWDKKWRVVMFDIPETKSKIRQEVSFKIKDIGMMAVQNSVFISPFPCKKEIDTITKHYDVDKYFIYLEADTVVSHQDLKKHFDVK